MVPKMVQDDTAVRYARATWRLCKEVATAEVRTAFGAGRQISRQPAYFADNLPRNDVNRRLKFTVSMTKVI
jgi:hypothetical protein